MIKNYLLLAGFVLFLCLSISGLKSRGFFSQKTNKNSSSVIKFFLISLYPLHENMEYVGVAASSFTNSHPLNSSEFTFTEMITYFMYKPDTMYFF